MNKNTAEKLKSDFSLSERAADILSAEQIPSFYSTSERISILQREARSWLATPFFDGIGRRAKKGTACDCVSWVAAVLQATGGIGPVPWPESYVSYTGGEDMLAILLGTLHRVPGLVKISAFQHVSVLEFQAGDILVGSTGRANHHIALFIGDNTMLHCWRGKVCEANIHDTVLTRHLHSIWRPIGADQKL